MDAVVWYIALRIFEYLIIRSDQLPLIGNPSISPVIHSLKYFLIDPTLVYSAGSSTGSNASGVFGDIILNLCGIGVLYYSA